MNDRTCTKCGEYIPMGRPLEDGVCAPCNHAIRREAAAAEKRMKFTPRYAVCSSCGGDLSDGGAELTATPDALAYLAEAGSHRARRALAEA